MDAPSLNGIVIPISLFKYVALIVEPTAFNITPLIFKLLEASFPQQNVLIFSSIPDLITAP